MVRYKIAQQEALLQERYAYCGQQLFDDELARFADSYIKHATLATRWLARSMLAEYLSVMPDDLNIQQQQGKPILIHPSNTFFAIAHSANYSACIVANHPVGIDIESTQSHRDWMGIAQFICNQHELSYLAALQDGNDIKFAVLTFWTRKEAYIKSCKSASLSIGDAKQINTFAPGFFTEQTPTLVLSYHVKADT